MPRERVKGNYKERGNSQSTMKKQAAERLKKLEGEYLMKPLCPASAEQVRELYKLRGKLVKI